MAFWKKKYETADLSTFRKLEGVGQEAYWAWDRARWEKIKAGGYSELSQPSEICQLRRKS
jgi:hypothetical protein